jgi:hypothetical protein
MLCKITSTSIIVNYLRYKAPLTALIYMPEYNSEEVLCFSVEYRLTVL